MIILEGTDAVGKTSTIEGLKKYDITCLDRSKDIISKYMLFDYTLEFRAKKYYEYLKNTECKIIFLINNDKDELLRRVYSRETISDFDLDTNKYNELYKETYEYMRKNNMLENKLFLVDVTNLSMEEQINKVRDVILCQE